MMRHQFDDVAARARHIRSGRVVRAVMVLAGLVVFGACEGDNLFKPNANQLTNDIVKPIVEIVRPATDMTIPLEDSVYVEVRVADQSGVAGVELIGIAHRGDADLGTDVVVTRFNSKIVDLTNTVPQDTVIRRYLTLVAGDQTNEFVSIVARVIDLAGNIGEDTARIYLGGPRVEIVNPQHGQVVRSGRNLAIRLELGDPNGLTSYQIDYEGVINGRIHGNFSPAQVAATIDTVIVLPQGADGKLTLTAAAQNVFGIVGRFTTVEVDVTSAAPPDTQAPTLSLRVTGAGRMEVTDSLLITITAQDDPGGGGLQRVGFTALAVNGTQSDTLMRADSVVFTTPRTGTVVAEFRVPPFNMDPTALPDTLVFLIHAFAQDSAGNCAAAVSSQSQQLACSRDRSFGGRQATLAAGNAGQRADAMVVTGRTIMLPNGGVIADAVVDTLRQRLYLSNITRNRVDALDLAQLMFLPDPILVGSEPWGLSLNRTQDSLIVANSAGTNIDLVHLNSGNLDRVRTPNLVLHEVSISTDATGRRRHGVTIIGFSDRPQFIAQDNQGRLLYSTKPTSAAEPGTVRMLDLPMPGMRPEAYILFPGRAIRPSQNTIALANIDSIQVMPDTSALNIGDVVRLFTHIPGMAGMPGGVLSNPNPLPLEEAIAEILTLRSDVIVASGTWDVSSFALQDTTYVAAAGNRSRIIFGEGAASPFGRVFQWNSNASELSSGIAVADLIDNAAERVNGVALNRDGSLGVFRGRFGAYYFTNDLAGELRLDGRFATNVDGAGAAMHPAHAANCTLASGSETCLSVVGTARNSIQVIETFHFYLRAEIPIRDNIVGPLRSSAPLPGDNAGIPINDPRRVIMKVYGVTSSGGVVIVDIRRRDLLPIE
ncbi:MAG TPA: hypothetical protein VNZ57_01565 [Longimicrobiales bacterium]|nr:hypothetical protein [Longimicrobiales bacterium]